MTLARRLKPLAPGLTARSVLEKFAAVQMIHLYVPPRGRELRLTRYTELDRVAYIFGSLIATTH